ncbi:MAG: succinate dehydrogenase, cytochrome b556 subunit [Nevskiaceae bacterium]|nr:MAG: succinate dehydrogenase, cytochrome b556 subunit [Nevskiaceae bacterium]TBR72805.1 MAG: succinate dehydrogenase, cytochrome b556 subunit [Nevskiaceae bacterium]
MPVHRRLSPHLGIYRWRVNMLQSTLHRLTGLFLCAGVLLVSWGAIAAAYGKPAWDDYVGFCTNPIGILLMIGWSWSLLFHLCNGVQHLVHDAARNYGPPVRDLMSMPVYWATGWFVVVVSALATLLLWAVLGLRMAGR